MVLIEVAALANAVTWSDYENRLTTCEDFDGIPDIIQTSDRTIWIFWSRNRAEDFDILYTVSFDEGTTWSSETTLVTNKSANTGVSVCQASDGTLWLVWASDRTGNYEIFCKTSSNLGISWSNDTQLTFDAADDLRPVIYQLSNGTLWLVWGSDRTGNYDLFLKTSSDAGSSWSASTQLTSDPYADKMPSLVQTPDESIWLVWATDRTERGDIYRMIYNGSAWSEETPLIGGASIDHNPDVLLTLEGTMMLFWSSRQSELAEDDVYYQSSSDDGNTWSAEVQFTTDPYDDMWVSVVQTVDRRIWVVWTSDRADQPDYGNWDVYYRSSLVGDVNGDGQVDILDLSVIGAAYGTFEGLPGYDPVADITVDGVVDVRDLALVTRNFGET